MTDTDKLLSSLDQLKKYTTVVADTGDINAIIEHKPQDATTNPSLILKAVEIKEYKDLFEEAISYAYQKLCGSERTEGAMERLLVNFAKEILKYIPGRVSVEVPAIFSYDTRRTTDSAISLVNHLEREGVDRDRVLVKIAATWEGIKAVEELEKHGTHTNSTLIFDQTQAIAVAEVNGTLISPFVGRVTDWYRKNGHPSPYSSASRDPGVRLVSEIYTKFKGAGYETEVMGASFRNVEQILGLAGCDLLTISPKLLSRLEGMTKDVKQKLVAPQLRPASYRRIRNVTEQEYRWGMGLNLMATYKLAEGIGLFNKDTDTLRTKVSSAISQCYR